MQRTRSIFAAACTITLLVIVTLIITLGQRLGWCQENELFYAEKNCLDSGLAPEYCKRLAQENLSESATTNLPAGELKKKEPRSKLQVHDQ